MTLQKAQRILVVGARSGGWTAARILGKRGSEVEVFEKQPLMHPGSGLPTIYQSGLIAANLITALN
ncbi:MAG: hypothetical protein WCT05_02260 [Lentisphaeria bacterium]